MDAQPYRMTAEDRGLFRRIASRIRSEPELFRPAGQWLDDNFSVDAIRATWGRDNQEVESDRKRIETHNKKMRSKGAKERAENLRALRKQHAEKPSDETAKKLKEERGRGFPGQVWQRPPHAPLGFDPESRIYGRLGRFQMAWNAAFGDLPELAVHKDREKVVELARRVLLMVWLVTDIDANSASFVLTKEFQPWEWGEQDTFESEGCGRHCARAETLEEDDNEKYIAAATEALDATFVTPPGDKPRADWWTHREAQDHVRNHSKHNGEGKASSALDRWYKKDPTMATGKYKTKRYDPNKVKQYCKCAP